MEIVRQYLKKQPVSCTKFFVRDIPGSDLFISRVPSKDKEHTAQFRRQVLKLYTQK